MFRRAIQLLLWQRPGRWLGKTPHHLENLDALLDVFPDAKIIQTHRDPVRVVASYASMMAHGRARLQRPGRRPTKWARSSPAVRSAR